MVAVRTLVLAAGALSLWLAAGDAVDPIYATGVPLVAWDSFYYREILVHGYPPAPGAVVAFFPAFPLAARPLLAHEKKTDLKAWAPVMPFIVVIVLSSCI